MLRVINKNQLIYTDKKIVCYGCGAKIQDLENLFSNNELENKLVYIVDNSPDKIGKRRLIQNNIYSIISAEEMLNKIDNNYIILITCYEYIDILNSLENDYRSRNMDIICLSHLLAIESETKALSQKIPRNVFKTSIQKIPKTIHYCWFGGKPIPVEYQRYIESWRKYCPDWDIIRWDETNYDISLNAYVREAYKNKKWAFVSDYARLDIIYNHGGVYLDIDVELINKIDDLLGLDAFLGFETWNRVNTGLGFGACKGHDLIKELRDDYDSKSFYLADGGINMTCCPEYQTEYLQKCGLIPNGEYQVIDGVHIFPEKMFCAKSMASMCVVKTDYSKSVHHFEGSWSEESKKKINYRLYNDMNEYFKSIK